MYFNSLFSYVVGILVTNLFSLLLIVRCILAIQQIITHKEHVQYSFWSVAIFWTSSEILTPSSQQQKVAKIASKSFSLSISQQKLPFFAVLMNALNDHPRYFKFKRKYQQYGPCFQTIFPFLMTVLIRFRSTCFKQRSFFFSEYFYLKNHDRILSVKIWSMILTG